MDFNLTGKYVKKDFADETDQSGVEIAAGSRPSFGKIPSCLGLRTWPHICHCTVRFFEP